MGEGGQATAHRTTHAATKRPRVLLVTHLFPTDKDPLRGPWVAEQADALANTVDLRVLCCSQLTSTRTAKRSSGVDVTYYSIATPLGRGRAGLLASTVRYARRLSAYVRRNASGLDLIHAHFGFPDAVVAWRVSKRTSLPLVVTLHGDDAFRLVGRRDLLGALVRRALEYASAVVCVSDAMASAVQGGLGPGSRILTIANGYDDALFDLSRDTRDLGVLFVGALVPVKNIGVLLEAYAAVRDRLSTPLVIAGEGPLRSDLERLADRLGITHDVRFYGRATRDEVTRLMSRAKCVVLPSESEGWPLVVAESLACGTPVVASRVGGVPEIMSGSDAGELVTPGDVDALAEALVRVATRTHDPERVAAASSARPWREKALEIAGVYADVLARDKARALA